MTTVCKGQPHFADTPKSLPVISFALVTVAAPARNIWARALSSCSSENHSAPAHGQCSHHSLLSGPPSRGLLFLFTACLFSCWVVYSKLRQDCQAAKTAAKRKQKGTFLLWAAIPKSFKSQFKTSACLNDDV